MCRWCSQIKSDYTECSFNPSRLISAPPPPPPPAPPPVLILVPYHRPSRQAHGIQGCFNTTSFDKNYWHFDFAINLFGSSFPPLLPPYIFAIPFAEKMHPFFLLIVNPKILFFRFSSLLQFLLLFNEYANYLYRRNWNRPINPVWPYPWFYWGERQIARITTPVLWLLPLNSQTFEFPISNSFNFQIC